MLFILCILSNWRFLGWIPIQRVTTKQSQACFTVISFSYNVIHVLPRGKTKSVSRFCSGLFETYGHVIENAQTKLLFNKLVISICVEYA